MCRLRTQFTGSWSRLWPVPDPTPNHWPLQLVIHICRHGLHIASLLLISHVELRHTAHANGDCTFVARAQYPRCVLKCKYVHVLTIFWNVTVICSEAQLMAGAPGVVYVTVNVTQVPPKHQNGRFLRCFVSIKGEFSCGLSLEICEILCRWC